MSVQALSCAFAIRGLSSSEKLVLLALANFANDEMKCWPSQERIAADTELSARTVWAAVKSLEDKRLLSKSARTRSDGTRASDVFTLHFALTIHSEPLANSAKTTRKSCEDHSQILQDQLATVATLTTFEPSLSLEPSKEEPLKAADAPVADLAEEIWQASNKASRNRSGRPAVRRAVTAAIRKGATPESLKTSVRDHCRTSGDHAKGLHRIIEAELWREHLAKPQTHDPPTPEVVAWRLRHYRDTREWRPEWGERPRSAA